MDMPEKIQILMRFLNQTIEKAETMPQKGCPYFYPQIEMLLFFVTMQLKGIRISKTVADYLTYR